MANTPNLGLYIQVGGTTPGANNNVTSGTYPYEILQNWDLIDSLVYSANNPPPPFVGQGTAPPLSGTYAQGAWWLNTTPTAGGPSYWVCTSSGSPGTWKAAGAISP